MIHVACIVIATQRRRAQVAGPVLASVLGQGFDDIIIVGDWAKDGSDVQREAHGMRYLCVEAMTHTTNDALVKRDVGALATSAEVLVYLCDDHALDVGFGSALREVLTESWDVIVPNRATIRDGERVRLNNGEEEYYCGGHAGVYRREVVTWRPWAAHAHHRNWDRLISHWQIGAGARYVWKPQDALTILDLEPSAEPWR